MAEEKKASGLDTENETDSIDYQGFSSMASASDDVNKVAQMSGVKLSLTRSIIKVKNHIAYIPFLFVILSMVVLTFALRDHNEAAFYLTSSSIAFWMFVDVLSSMLATLCYMNATAKHVTKGKKIAMSALFYVLMLVQILIDLYMLHDYIVEQNLANSPIVSDKAVYAISESGKWLNIHLAFVYITLVLAVLEPFLQPLFSKIKVHL
jgi:hypothetical protein